MAMPEMLLVILSVLVSSQSIKRNISQPIKSTNHTSLKHAFLVPEDQRYECFELLLPLSGSVVDKISQIIQDLSSNRQVIIENSLSRNISYCRTLILGSFDITEIQYTLQHRLPYSNVSIILLVKNQTSVENLKQIISRNRTTSSILIVDINNFYQGHGLLFPKKKFKEINLPLYWPPKVKLPIKLSEREVSVLTFDCPSFSRIGDVDENGKPDEWTGSEVTLFTEIAKRLNVSWRVKRMDVGDTSPWGYQQDDGEWLDGLIPRLMDGETDIGFCSMWMTKEKLDIIDLSSPVFHLCMRLVVPRPKELGLGPRHITAFFTKKAWIFLILSIMIVGSGLVVLAHYSRVQNNFTRRYLKLPKALFLLYGMLVQASIPPSRSEYSSLRPLITSWILFSLYVVNIFSSGLVVRLTTPVFSAPINNIEDLMDANFFWGTTIKSNYHQLIYNLESPVYKKFVDSLVDETVEERLKHLTLPNYFLVTKSIDSVLYFQEPVDENINNFQTGQCVSSTIYTAFGFRPGSVFLPHFNHYIVRAIETGISSKIVTDEAMKDYKTNPFVMRAFFHTKASRLGNIPLGFEHMSVFFYFLFIGQVIATIVFIGEIVYFKWLKKLLKAEKWPIEKKLNANIRNNKKKSFQFRYCE